VESTLAALHARAGTQFSRAEEMGPGNNLIMGVTVIKKDQKEKREWRQREKVGQDRP